MTAWEYRLQNQVDEVLFNWMKEKSKTSTTPPECISVLEAKGVYKPTNRPGKPLRDDLREAREIGLPYKTKHLRFEQDRENANWFIMIDNL